MVSGTVCSSRAPQDLEPTVLQWPALTLIVLVWLVFNVFNQREQLIGLSAYLTV